MAAAMRQMRQRMRRLRKQGGTIVWIVLCVLLTQGLAEAQVTARVTESMLENGLKILLLEEHKASVVTVHIWYRVGARNEQPGTTGLSHLLEHMMFKGTSKVGPGQFSRTIRKNGGRDNAFTSEDYTGYFETFASDRIDLALKLEADRMRNLLLDPKEIEAEKKVVMEERRLRTEDDPVSALREAMGAAAFQAHPYRQPVIGWMTDIERLARRIWRATTIPTMCRITLYWSQSVILKATNCFQGFDIISARFREAPSRHRSALWNQNSGESGDFS